MKRNFNFRILAGSLAALILSACNDDSMETPVAAEQQAQSQKIDQPNDLEKVCYYVDQYWSSSSVLLTSL